MMVAWMKCECYCWPIVFVQSLQREFRMGLCGYCKTMPWTFCEAPPDNKAHPLPEREESDGNEL